MAENFERLVSVFTNKGCFDGFFYFNEKKVWALTTEIKIRRMRKN